MGDSQYRTLQDRYQKIRVQVKHLEDENHMLQEANNEIHRRMMTEEEQVRAFCRKQLSNISEELKDDKSLEWEKLQISELLILAQDAINAKDDNWRKTYETLFHKVEQRRAENETLKEKIKALLEKVEGEEKPGEMLPQQHPGIQYVSKDDSDDIGMVGSAEDKLLQEAKDTGRVTALRSGAKKILESKTSAARKQKLKEEQKKANRTDGPSESELRRYEEMLNDGHWFVIRCIGEKGISVLSNIIMEGSKNIPEFKEHKIRACGELLIANGITENALITSFKTRNSLYNLTRIGKTLYEKRHKKKPVKSEWEKLVQEHTTLEHGFGIRIIADTLRETSYYDEVDEFRRKKPIKLSQGKSLVPDIVCSREGVKDLLLEYELNTCTQADLNEKLNHIAEAAEYLNFIVPNSAEEETLRDRITRWVKSKNKGVLARHTIRVTTSFHVQDVNLYQNSSWHYIMQPGSSTEWKQMFKTK